MKGELDGTKSFSFAPGNNRCRPRRLRSPSTRSALTRENVGDGNAIVGRFAKDGAVGIRNKSFEYIYIHTYFEYVYIRIGMVRIPGDKIISF